MRQESGFLCFAEPSAKRTVVKAASCLKPVLQPSGFLRWEHDPEAEKQKNPDCVTTAARRAEIADSVAKSMEFWRGQQNPDSVAPRVRIPVKHFEWFRPVSATVFRRDVKLTFADIRGHDTPDSSGGGGGNRGRIVELSMKSRLRMLHTAKNADVDFLSMATLTYPKIFPGDGRRVKRDIDAFLKALKRKFWGVEFLWFLEFQARGAPHFHILMNAKASGPGRTWMSETWFRIVASQDEKHLRAGTNWEALRTADGGIRYVAKYACKTIQKMVPPTFQNVGRFWGCSKGCRPVAREIVPIDEAGLILACPAEKLRAKSGRINSYLWDQASNILSSHSKQPAVKEHGVSKSKEMDTSLPIFSFSPVVLGCESPSIAHGLTFTKCSRRTYQLRPFLTCSKSRAG